MGLADFFQKRTFLKCPKMKSPFRIGKLFFEKVVLLGDALKSGGEEKSL